MTERIGFRLDVFILLLACAAQLSAGAPSDGERLPVYEICRAGTPIAIDGPDQGLFNEAVLIFSNAARRAHGRPPLRHDPALTRAAAEHARNMARLRTHSHVLPVRGQGKLAQRMHRQSLAFRMAAENIIAGLKGEPLPHPINKVPPRTA